MTLEKITVLFDDIASGSFPVLESGSRGVFPKPGGWDLVSYKNICTERDEKPNIRRTGRIIVR